MSNISIGELTVIADTGHTQCGDAAEMARELLEYRKASTQPVGEVVAWGESIPPRQGIARKVDFRWLDVNVEPGTLLYAAPQLKQSSNPEQFAITHDMAMAFHHALNDGGIGHEDLEDIKIGLRAAFANCGPQLQPVSNPYMLPAGWVMVPSELTPCMQDAWDSAPNGNEDDDVNMRNAYRAMIASAPQPDKCHK